MWVADAIQFQYENRTNYTGLFCQPIWGLRKMGITRVWIEEGCISCGMSEGNCPEVFKVKDVGATVIEGVDYSGLEEKIKDAANACPVQVIMYDET